MCVRGGCYQGRDVKLYWSGDSRWVMVKGHGSGYCEFLSTGTALSMSLRKTTGVIDLFCFFV